MASSEKIQNGTPESIVRLTQQNFILVFLSEILRQSMYSTTFRLTEKIGNIEKFLNRLFDSDLLTPEEKGELKKARDAFIETINQHTSLTLPDFMSHYQSSQLALLIDAYAGGFRSPPRDRNAEIEKNDFWTHLQSLSIEAIPLEPQALLEYKNRALATFLAARRYFDQETHLVEIENNRPTLILADIHGRRQFILAALTREIEINGVCASVYTHLHAKKLDLMFVGDFSHPEISDDWTIVKKRGDEYYTALRENRQLDQVMSDSLGALQMVCVLKQRFPNQVFLVSGNHDNVYGVGGSSEKLGFELIKNGINQNKLARDYLDSQLGTEFLQELSVLERAIPLMIVKKNPLHNSLVLSHAVPTRRLDVFDIRTNTLFAQVELTFNNNTPSRLGEKGIYNGVVGTLTSLNIPIDSAYWVIGHCVVEPHKTSRRQVGNRVVQICDPYRRLVAYVPADMSRVDSYAL